MKQEKKNTLFSFPVFVFLLDWNESIWGSSAYLDCSLMPQSELYVDFSYPRNRNRKNDQFPVDVPEHTWYLEFTSSVDVSVFITYKDCFCLSFHFFINRISMNLTIPFCFWTFNFKGQSEQSIHFKALYQTRGILLFRYFFPLSNQSGKQIILSSKFTLFLYLLLILLKVWKKDWLIRCYKR